MKVNRIEIVNETQLRNMLDRIYKSASEGEKFFNILELIQNEQVALTAIHNIKSNKGSKTAGIDGKTVDYFLQLPKEECIMMILDSFNNYKPIPVKRVYIPKGNKNLQFKQSEGKELLKLKKVRPLGIPTIIDRIIQEMVRIVLEPIFEAQFYPHSYGFRPYRSCEHAIGWITRVINKSKLYIAIEGDIKSYFDNINHNKLIEIMWNMGVKDKRVLMIIKKMLKAGYMESAKLYDTITGSPQGGIISPLLANIYLNNFDWLMGSEYEFHPQNANYKQKKNALVALRNKSTHPVFYIRYADDWIILTDTIENAERLKRKASKYLEHKLKLSLSEEKTLITDTRNESAKFLGFNIKSGKQRFGDMIIARAIPDTKKLSTKVNEIKKDIRYLIVRKKELERQLDIEKINSKIVGLSNYIKMGISKEIMSAIDNRLEKTAYKTWVKIYGKYKVKLMKIPISEFDNRIDRHEGYNMKHFSIKHNGIIVGLTFFKITPVKYAEVFKQEMSPYTKEGRKLYSEKARKKARLLARPLITSPDDMWLYLNSIHSNSKYNLEYFLNREYAFNRDKGKCKVCGTYLNNFNYRCHHKMNKLPINMINKVKNLISVCNSCHKIIHSNKEVEETDSFDKSAIIRLNKLRKLISLKN